MECNPLIVSLGNLAEQSRALSNVKISNTPLRDFPELEDRLRFKLLEATDTVLNKLNEKMWVSWKMVPQNFIDSGYNVWIKD